MEYLHVTCVKPMRGFLEIHGHKKPELLRQLESEIGAYQPHTKKFIQTELHPNWEFDTVYLALSEGKNLYHRCIITEKRPNNRVIIELIDYGKTFEIETTLLLELDPKNRLTELLKECPPIATRYILANFFCNWKFNEREIIETLLMNTAFPITNEQMDREINYIALDYKGTDVARKLISSNVGMDISFTEQRMEIRKINQRYDVFSNGSNGSNGGAGSPAKRERRRPLVANRPLQTAANNNTLTDRSKRMIQSHLATNSRGYPLAESSANEGQPSAASRIPTFTANELTTGQFHVVYSAYIEDGPNLFSVHLKSQEHILDRLCSDIANASHRLLEPRDCITGMACIVRYSADKNLYRAVIQKVQAEGCRVTFIDYGNSEFVEFSDMFHISKPFLDHKTFAMSFQLYGCKELGPTNERLNKYFETLVTDKQLDLRVIPSKSVDVQQCELFLPDGSNALKILKDKKDEFNSFPNPPHLREADFVMIRYAYSAKQFYVAKVDNSSEFDAMMDSLLDYCMRTPEMAQLPSKGKCCAARYNGDNTEWYRVTVTDPKDAQHIEVHLVDFGNDVTLHLSDLRDITAQFLVLPRQAIECCLVDFEDAQDVPLSTRRHLDMLVEDTNNCTIHYRASVRHRLPNSAYVVDLLNEEKDLRVSVSVYKLAMPSRAKGYAKASIKGPNEVEKPARQGATNRNNNYLSQREIDGAERPEKFVETNAQSNDRQRDRFAREKGSNDDYSRYERAKPRNDNSKIVSNGSPKNYATRSDFENHRGSGDKSKKPILQKHIIPRFNKRPNRSRNKHNGKRTIGGNSSTVSIQTEDFVGFNPTLPGEILPLNSTSKVVVVHWSSPFEFFVQLKSMDAKCDEMMHQLQKYYRRRASVQQKVPIGSLVLVRHRHDQVIKRAKIIDYNEERQKYRVKFIDYGYRDICQQNDIFEMEKSFTLLPAMASCCTFENVILNKTEQEIEEQISKLLSNNNPNVECKFVRKVDDKAIVDLSVNGVNVRDLMIQEKSLINLPKDIHLKRLVGQTIMAYITAIRDLSSFQAQFYGCDIAFMCSYKDFSLVKKDPQLLKHFQSYLEKYVKVTIRDVAPNNVLTMDLHLPRFNDDGSLAELCNYPVFNDEFDGLITHIEPPNTVYVQDSRFTHLEQQLLEDLYNAYEKDGVVCTAPDPNQTYVALAQDGNCYRCRIEQLQNEDLVLVRWIDYGNTEVIPKMSLKLLDEKFKAPISILAREFVVPLKFRDENSTLCDVNLGEDYAAKVNILGNCQRLFVCDLIQNGMSVFKQMEQEQKVERLDIEQLEKVMKAHALDRIEKRAEPLIEKPAEPPIEKPAENQNVEQQQQQIESAEPTIIDKNVEQVAETDKSTEVEVTTPSAQQANVPADASPPAQRSTERELVFITHVDSPNRFYIQLNSDAEAIERMQELLQIVAPQLPSLSDFRAGQLCNGKYSIDEQWYRAKIIDTDGEITSIQFVDYGNTDSITNNALLKSADSSLNSSKPFAMACSLPIKPFGSNEWAESASNKLRTLIHDTPLEYEIISHDKDVTYVKLFFVGGRNIVKELIEEGVAEPLEIIKSGEKCFISHFNSLSDFFIQVDSDAEVLAKIEQHLRSDSDSVVLASPTVGTICSAQFEDGAFYRARIIDVLPDAQGFEVEFLDYGNAFQTTDVRSLKPEIGQLPHLRKHCSLKMPDDLQNWSDEAEQRFREISSDGETAFTVNLVKPGKKASIELIWNDQNVSDVLSNLCEKRPISPMIIDEQEIVPEIAPINPHPVMHCGEFAKGKQACFISHINGPDDFYIHFPSRTDDLNMVAAELAKTSDYDDINRKEVVIGSIVAALYPEDGSFYRARVIEQSADGVLVHFIDYGNKCDSTKIRKLPDILSPIIPLATNCSLIAEKLLQMNPTDKKIFATLTDDPELTFQVEAVNISTPKATVELCQNDKDILQVIKHMKNSQDSNVANSVLSNIIEEAVCSSSAK